MEPAILTIVGSIFIIYSLILFLILSACCFDQLLFINLLRVLF